MQPQTGKPNVNWGPEYEAEVKALEAEEAAMKAAAEPKPAVEPASQPAAPQAEPAPAAAAEPAPAEPAPSDDLQKQIAEKDARIAELERQVQVEIGRHGGELGFLRNQVRTLTEQLQKMQQPNQPAAPAATEEPLIDDDFRKEYPEIAERIEKASRAALAKAEKLTKAQREEQAQAQEAQRRNEFANKLYGAVPNFDEVNADPRWIAWLNSRPRGDVRTRLQRANEFAATFEADPLIELVQDFQASIAAKPTPAPAVQTPPPAPEPARAKPSPASQAVPPVASTPATVPQGDPKLTLKRLNDLQKMLVSREYDPKKHDELMREFGLLSEAAEKGELK